MGGGGRVVKVQGSGLARQKKWAGAEKHASMILENKVG